MEFLNFLASHRTPAGNLFFQLITYLAQEVFVVTVICWFYWCKDKGIARCLGLAYFSSGLLVQGLKITFRIPRPWILDPSFQAVPSALPDATGYSFPSGHTQSITSLFGTGFAFFRKKVLRFFCAAVIAAVMFSRMYLGCHTPKDVLVSFLATSLCVIINYYLYRSNSFKNKKGLVSVIMILSCLLLAFYAVFLNRSGIIEVKYASDCIKASGAGLAFAIGFYAETRYINFSMPASSSRAFFRFIFGLIITLILQVGLKPLIGQSLAASFIRYFLVVFWIVFIYPLLFTKIS